MSQDINEGIERQRIMMVKPLWCILFMLVTAAGSATAQVTVSGSVYGGGNEGAVHTNSAVDIKAGTVTGSVYGGGNKADVTGSVTVDMTGGTVNQDVYGGGALANTNIGNWDGYVVATGLNDGESITDLYTRAGTEGNYSYTKVTDSSTTFASGTFYRATWVHTEGPAHYKTTVNLTDGTVNRDVYGGGLGRTEVRNESNEITTEGVEAKVYGDVEVNIGSGTVSNGFASAVDGKVTINGSVYGCNNVNGTPKGNVVVNVYKTAHTEENTCPNITTLEELETAVLSNTPEKFAIAAVFGGGNKAAYNPVADSYSTTVHVYACEENTIQTVYGGGNAADATNVNVIIDGGYFDQVFGGGNGFSATNNHSNPSADNYNPGANISGSATTNIHGGLYRQLFGGSNQYGNVASASLSIDNASGCRELIYESFGGANEADITGDITTTLACSNIQIGSFYGGSNLANITGNVTLNVEGGTYLNVFGGSKGRLAKAAVGTENQEGYQPPVTAKAANITGDVTLNLYGGTMDNAFGGSDVNGNITGKITVNMLDKGGPCGLVVHNIYGGGRDAAYTPTTPGAYPEVNLIHGIVSKKTETVEGNTTYTGGNVFGGGLGATAIVSSSPKVTVGYDSSMSSLVPAGYTLSTASVTVQGDVYGGGEKADVTGSITMTVQQGTVENMSISTTVQGDVYGGGALANTNTDQTTNIGTEQDPAHHSTTVTVTGGTVRDVYGGGLGCEADNSNPSQPISAVAALVNGAVEVTVNGGTVTNVFGCNNVNGAPQGTVTVTIEQTAASMVVTNVFGGGNLAAYSGSPTVYINNGTVSGNVYGGGNGDPADNTQTKGSTAAPTVTIGDPTSGHETYVAIVGGDVYGGGNAAKVTGTTAPTVRVQKCNTQVGYVYGGGNAADVPATNVSITGGIISHDVYGGGHGDKASLNVDENDHSHSDKAANVTGNVSVSVTGGTIDKVFAGSNLNGAIGGTVALVIDKAADACDMKIGEVYGGGNQAAGNAGTITIGCTGTWTVDDDDTDDNDNFHDKHNDSDNRIGYELEGIGTVYGGANAADIGAAGEGNASNITLTMNSGIVDNVFGGNNTSGTIYGTIQVNINKTDESSTCGWYVGNVFGGGNLASYSGSPTVTVTNGQVSGSVYGGGNEAGVGGSTVNINGGGVSQGVYGGCNTSGVVSGNITLSLTGGAIGVNGTTTDVVYGGGYGHETSTTGNIGITLGGTTVYGNLYGGSALGTVNAATIDINGSNLHGKIFGGGMGSGTGNDTKATTNGNVTINYNTTNTNLTGLYGGANVNGLVSGNIVVNVKANVGATGANNSIDIFGGGLGAATTTGGNVTVNVGDDTNTAQPVIYGNVYGGSEFGSVNDAVTDLTTVNILSGTLHGNVYGGGLGEANVYTGETLTTDNSAKGQVNGTVIVNIGATDGAQTPTYTGFATIDGDVYGCNDTNGSPKGDVTVNIYKTAHTSANTVPDTPSGGWTVENLTTNSNTQGYAIHAVYGGGNLAAYIPAAVASGDDPHSTTVHVYTCDNTIQDIYGGGNAADVGSTGTGAITANTNVIIDGGRIKNVFGGGNGAGAGNPGANIYGTARTTLRAGIIDKVFGGSNEKGSITSIHLVLGNNNVCDMFYGDVFGGGNLAELTGNLETTIECGAGYFGNFYGGANQADITGNVTLNIFGGTYDNVFGGSKGVAGTPANITGNVTLNLYGGTMDNAFGGSDVNGNITGKISVNMLENGGNCGLVVHNIYGGGRDAAYTPTYTVEEGETRISPEINLIHGSVTKSSSSSTDGNVFGGGKGGTAIVTSNPKVNIGYDATSMGDFSTPNTLLYKLTHNVTNYTSTTTAANFLTSVAGNVYGGGDLAVVTGNTSVTLTKGSVGNDIYGGGNQANVTGAVTVELNGGTVAHDVYGGGALAQTNTLYTSGSSLATYVTLAGAAVTGSVYGGGLGRQAVTEVIGAPAVYTAVEDGTTLTQGETYYTSNTGDGEFIAQGTEVADGVNGTNYFVLTTAAVEAVAGVTAIAANVNGPVTVEVTSGSAGNVFGCNNLNGAPQQAVSVAIGGGNIGTVYGGGNEAHYDYADTESPLAVTMTGGTVGYLFGGGNKANVAGSVKVSVSGGTVTNDIYGGGALAHTNTANWNFTTDTWQVSGSTAGTHYEEVKHLTKDLSSVTGYYEKEGSTYTLTSSTTAVEGVTYYKLLPNTITDQLYNIAKNGTTYKTTVELKDGTLTNGTKTYPTVGNVYGGGLGELEVAEVLAQDAVYYNAATAALFNAGLPDALPNSIALTVEQATAYNNAITNGKITGSSIATDGTGTLTAAEANAYNATLSGAKKDGDLKTPAVAYVAPRGTPAMVYGDVSVSVANTIFTNQLEDDNEGKKVVKTGRVFGGNNLYGTPKGSVTVTVTSTRRADGGLHKDDEFEILAVYGGGNVANYKPQTYDTETEFGQRSHVIIDGCSVVSIEKVYGGGNAASVPFTDVDIEGAYQIGYVFGGGNGGDKTYYNNGWHVNPGANVPGYANVLLKGGTIGQAFGGSDTKGSVGGAEVKQEPGTGGCALHIVNLYGAGNGEEANSEGDVLLTLSSCANSNIQKVFGGSYRANIKGNVTLNIISGILTSVFGGNDRMGSIAGKITVNIEETEDCDNPIIIQNLYGGSYETDYPGESAPGVPAIDKNGNKYTKGKIIVNVKSATRIDKVYGGSYKATVNGDTEVNINMTKGIRAGQTVTLPAGYRGDGIPNLEYSDKPKYIQVPSTEITVDKTSVYGLWEVSAESETGYKEIKDESALAVADVTYYELRQTGTINNKIGTIGTVYGGGYQGDINGKATVNIGTANEVEYETTPTHLTPKTNGKYDVVGAHITGDVYGGGNQAKVMEDTRVNFCTADYSGVAAFEGVSVEKGTIHGGGREADVLGNTYVKMSGGYVYNGVFGGGLAGSVGTYERDYTQTTDEDTDVEFDHSTHTCLGKPTRCTKGGKCTVLVDGGQIGPITVATKGMTRPMSEDGPVGEGWVWGAGRGVVVDPKDDPDMHFKAYVNETDVTIGGSAFIMASVIGGGEFGRVLHDTHVTIQDTCQIGVGAGQAKILSGSGTSADPYVYGDPIRYYSSQWSAAETAVKAGNAEAINTIAAKMPECSHFDYGRDTNNDGKPEFLTWDPYYDKYSANTGATTIGPASSSNASDGKTWIGCVFGGGSGYYPYEKSDGTGYGWVRSAGMVEGNTLLEIKGGHILTNVYGGNEYTDVAGKCTVKMTGGTIGVPRTLAQIKAHPLTCYLFGAGKGDPRPYFSNMTNAGSTEVDVSGGVIYGSVFGGSEDGHVLGNTVVNIKPDAWIGTWGTSYVDGNVFGGGRGFSGETLTAGAVCGNTQINITGGTMLGSIYGGGRLASVGSYLVAEGDGNYGKLMADDPSNVVTPAVNYTQAECDDYNTTNSLQEGDEGYRTTSDVKTPAVTEAHGHTEVNISGGTIGNNIEFAYEPAPANRTYMPETVFDTSNRLMHTRGGNVFAGSMGRREGLDDIAMTRWRELGMVKSTTLNISGTAWIKGNVFGGGEFGAVTGSHTIDSKPYGTEINIIGGTVGTMIESEKAPSAVDASYTGSGDSRYTFGSVYGGGYGTEADATLTTNDVEAFGAFVNSNTYVKMTGGKVRASVYGGGEMACVKGNTYVDVSAGEIGIDELRVTNGPKKDYVLFGGWRMGNVFGGGKGSKNAVYSGLVAGNTNVNISGGSVYHNVYGGGALSSVGTYTLADATYHGSHSEVPVGAPRECTAGGTATVTITGGQIGINGWDNGMVNGSGRGDISTNKPTGTNPYDVYDNLGWVNNSFVTIGSSTTNPLIKGTVYGGGENGHNLGNASVTVHSGTIGTSATSSWENGNVFGSGCGTDTYDESTDAVKYFNPMGGRVRGNTTVLIDGGHILRNAYGGGSMASADGLCSITVSGGRIGTDGTTNTYGSGNGNVYGGPKGNLLADHAAHVGSTAVNISYSYNDTDDATDNDTPTGDNATHDEQLIIGSVYGGGEAGIVYGGVAVNMNGGLVMKDVYGGGALANTNTSNWNASTNTWATGKYVASTGTTHKSIVSLKGGTVQHNVYGGGLGRLEVFTAAEATTYNTENSLSSGSAGYKYGGDAKPSSIAAKVYGDVLVKLNETTDTDNCVVKGNIFGCNNLYGSPQSSVTVHVYKTVGYDDSHMKSTTKGNTTYDLAAVYGGGDLAMYKPDVKVETDDGPKDVADTAKTRVIIDGCQLTSIQKVYGGGNAASVPATSVRVNGTYEIGELFGGGNGKDQIPDYGGITTIDNPGANVGYVNYSTLSGTTWTDKDAYDTKEERLASPEIQYGDGSTSIVVTGGRIHACYGGSDTKGNVRRKVISSYEDAGTCDMIIDETYGGGKDAPMDADIEVNLECAEDMATIFGGSKNADLNSNVNLHITNGTYQKVFGGNNTSGAVNGFITITVEEKGCKPVIIGELYGGGYLAPYSVYGYKKKSDGTYDTESVPYVDTDGTTKYLDQRIPLKKGDTDAPSNPLWLDPRINIISATYIGTIYGGGYQAKVVGSPHINVNMEEGKILAKYTDQTGFVGTHTATLGSETITYTGKELGDEVELADGTKKKEGILALGKIGTIFGGGNMADVIGNTDVEIGTGSWVERERNNSGVIVETRKDNLTRKEATITGNVYGGGKMGHVGYFTPDASGKPASCAPGTGICKVTINNGTIGSGNMMMYHLDSTGKVPADDMPDDRGHVFGGGQGTLDYYYDDYNKTDAEKLTAMAGLTTDEMNAKLGKLAFVDSTEVNIGGTAFVQGCVFGGAENGHVLRNTGVRISGGQIGNGHILLTDPNDGSITVNRGVNRPYTPAEWTAGHLFVTGDSDIDTSDPAEIALRAAVPDPNEEDAPGYSYRNSSLPECAAWPYGKTISGGKIIEGEHHSPYDKFANAATEGDIEKYANGASTNGGHRVASSGRTFYGSVFGGGSGYFPYAPGKWLDTAGQVEGDTWVAVTGGHILTSLYGGNEMTSVKGDTHVIMSGGTLGVPRTLDEIDAHPVTCYVFGGGKGEGRSFLDGKTTVQNARVDIKGGWVYGSVFGGAEDGFVLGNAHVTVSGTVPESSTTYAQLLAGSATKIGTWGTSYVDGNVFGGGRGYDGHNSVAGNVGGNVIIGISGGEMLGSVYGGGRLGSVGIDLNPYKADGVTANPNFGKMMDGDTHGHITVNISGGTIGNKHEYIIPTATNIAEAGITDESKKDIANWENSDWTKWKKYHKVPKTEFDPSNGRLVHTKGGNVFVGGMGRRLKLNNVDPITGWTELGKAKSTKLTISGGTIKGNVYGGGEFGAVTGYHLKDTKHYGTEISIAGANTIIGSEIKDGAPVKYTFGSVYGGGYGTDDEVTDTLTNIDVGILGALVSDSTYISMSGGHVWASVYGGGEVAAVGGNTNINISGGEIGKDSVRADGYVLFGGATMGNVYGSGKGTIKNPLVGVVKGNTTINISGGSVYHNVYGGGAVASVGTFHPNGSVSGDPVYVPAGVPYGWPDGDDINGIARINITGGIIGISGHDNGMVNGSSRGNVERPYMKMALFGGNVIKDPYDRFAWVNKSVVNIGTSGSSTGPKVKGSVYGGGENGHNNNDATVNIYSGTIGIPQNETWGDVPHSSRGNVYGAGCGTDFYWEDEDGDGVVHPAELHHNPWAGVVCGNTYVNIYGGHVLHNVYGGGSIGSVGALVNDPDADIHTNPKTEFAHSWPSVFAYSSDASGKPISGKATVNVKGGRIGTTGSDNGDVFGGTKGEAGNPYRAAHLGTLRATEVNIDFTSGTPADDKIVIAEKIDEEDNKQKYSLKLKDGEEGIAGSVYGGGEDGHVYENTQVNIKNGYIGHAVYGGGKGKGEYIPLGKSEAISSITAGKVYGNTEVNMSGGHVLRNVYGGGNLGSVGKGNYACGPDDYYYVPEDPNYIGYGEKLETNLWDGVSDGSKAFLGSGIATVKVTGGIVGFMANDDTEVIPLNAATSSRFAAVTGTGANPDEKKRVLKVFSKDNLPTGNIFGGCRGQASAEINDVSDLTPTKKPDFFLGYVNETVVTIGDASVTNGPRIYGSVYGGGQDGHVRRGTAVTINKGEIGLPFNSTNMNLLGGLQDSEGKDNLHWLHRGNVYGGGSGIGKYEDSTGEHESNNAGSVTHTTSVTVNNGIDGSAGTQAEPGNVIYRNVYGGGSLASVTPPIYAATAPNPDDRDGWGKMACNTVTVLGTVGVVSGYDKTYGGEVYGGSRGEWGLSEDLFAVSAWTKVFIKKGAHIMGNVFGGGDAGRVLKDTKVVVGDNP